MIWSAGKLSAAPGTVAWYQGESVCGGGIASAPKNGMGCGTYYMVRATNADCAQDGCRRQCHLVGRGRCVPTVRRGRAGVPFAWPASMSPGDVLVACPRRASLRTLSRHGRAPANTVRTVFGQRGGMRVFTTTPAAAAGSTGRLASRSTRAAGAEALRARPSSGESSVPNSTPYAGGLVAPGDRGSALLVPGRA